MTDRPIHLIDQNAANIATLEVRSHDDHFEGTICLDSTPTSLRQLFEEFEEIVEGQMFSVLDAIEEKIAAVGIRVVFDNGAEAPVSDLQVFPSTRAISFTTHGPQVTADERRLRVAQVGSRTLGEILRTQEGSAGSEVTRIGEPSPGS